MFQRLREVHLAFFQPTLHLGVTLGLGFPGGLGLFFLGGDPTQVVNAGCPRAIDAVRLREGSLLLPRFPAPLGMRGLTMMRVLAALNGLVAVAGAVAVAVAVAWLTSCSTTTNSSPP